MPLIGGVVLPRLAGRNALRYGAFTCSQFHHDGEEPILLIAEAMAVVADIRQSVLITG